MATSSGAARLEERGQDERNEARERGREAREVNNGEERERGRWRTRASETVRRTHP